MSVERQHIIGEVKAILLELQHQQFSERIKAGLRRAKASGKSLGRPLIGVHPDALAAVDHLSCIQAAKTLGVPRMRVYRARARRDGRVSH